MEPYSSESPFQDLPEALVEEMLSHYKKLGDKLTRTLQQMRLDKDKIRDSLRGADLLKDDSTIISSHAYPTTCGVDGSYTIERLLSTDIAAMASVAVEGLTPPTEKRHWPSPHHLCDVFTLSHHEATSLLIRAIMITMELEMAVNAPHDAVFLDGSLTTPIIHINQALSRLAEVSPELSLLLSNRLEPTLDRYKEVLASKRSDKVFAGVPKYTSRREISEKIGSLNYEDRSLLSYVLRGGELAGPLNMVQPGESWRFTNLPENVKTKGNEITGLIKELSVLYYRPYEYFPALRIEVSPSIAKNPSRLSVLLESLQLQCGAPGIMEPYPLYLADRMVKHLSSALPAIRKATTQEMASSSPEAEVGNIFLAMHPYRTDS